MRRTCAGWSFPPTRRLPARAARASTNWPSRSTPSGKKPRRSPLTARRCRTPSRSVPGADRFQRPAHRRQPRRRRDRRRAQIARREPQDPPHTGSDGRRHLREGARVHGSFPVSGGPFRTTDFARAGQGTLARRRARASSTCRPRWRPPASTTALSAGSAKTSQSLTGGAGHVRIG